MRSESTGNHLKNTKNTKKRRKKDEEKDLVRLLTCKALPLKPAAR